MAGGTRGAAVSGWVVHQYHPCARPGDAVTQHMLLLRDCLRAAGIEGTVFAPDCDAREALGIENPSPGGLRRADLILLHHSTGNPELEKVLLLRRPIALVYHNITPGGFFRHDPVLAGLAHLGRSQLERLRDRVRFTLTVSDYNARELSALGFRDVRLVPLLDLAASRTEFPEHGHEPSGDLLFVGRVTPHKSQDLLVRVLFHLAREHGKRFRLVLVGSRDPVYADYVSLVARSLGVRDSLCMNGAVDAATLDLHYRHSAAFLCVSRHEGFCIPLVEAMKARLPVFALARTGVASTLGRAGIQLGTLEPHQIATIVAETLSDGPACGEIVAGQDQRLAELGEFQCARVMVETVTACLNDLAAARPRPEAFA